MPETVPLIFRFAFVAIGLVLWMLQYFAINRSSRPERPRFHPRTRLDALIPVVPRFAPVYFSTYLLALAAPLLVADTVLFLKLAVSYALVTLVGSTIHVLVPSRIERLELSEEVPDQSLSVRLLARFQRFCRPYGNFPSIHVAFGIAAIIVAYAAYGALAGVLVLVWAVLIAVSTLVTRQHYVADVAAGAALGGAVTGLVFLAV